MNSDIRYHSNGAYKVIDALVKLTERKQLIRGICPLLDHGNRNDELIANIEHLRHYVAALENAAMQDKTIL